MINKHPKKQKTNAAKDTDDGYDEHLYTMLNEDDDNENEDKRRDSDKPLTVPFFEKKTVEHVHGGPVFNITCSNGILISSAIPTNLSLKESFYFDHIVYDIRCLMNTGTNPRLISRLHNLNSHEKDVTRLLALSPATPRHVRECGGPGTLIAATGYHQVYCHNLLDVFMDSLALRIQQ